MKDLESPSSTLLEARVPSHDSRAMMRSPSPRAWKGDLTSLAPHERLPDILFVPHEKSPRGATARRATETPPSSRSEGLLFLHGLESNPESSLLTEEEALLP